MLPRTFRISMPVDYEPSMADSMTAIAEAAGRNVFDVVLDMLLEENGKALLMNTFENYFDGDLEVVRTLLEDPATISGIADAGAHVGYICDASSATSMLTHWARDRRRGDKLGLEFLVRKQTRDTAHVYGLTDRGVIAPGLRADFNIIDFDALQVLRPEITYDLPAGGRRFVQKAKGYRHTFVAGIEVMHDGEATGALPGRLVRGPR